MAEKNDFTHLPLPLLFQGKPKLRGGGAVSAQTKRNTANRIAHGSYVKRRSAELSRFWKERRAERSENALPEIETGIPILLEIDPSADIDFLRGLGFEIVCEIEEGFIIVATEDVDLSTLNEKADAFIANVTTRCNSPAKVYALCEDGDRLKRVLSKELYAKWATVSPDEAYIIDIGVSCCGNIELPKRPKREDDETDEHYSVREQRWMEKFSAAYMAWDEIKMKREETIERFVSDYNGEIMQLADGISEMTDLPDSFSARLKISGKCLLDLVLNFAYIFEVSEAETIIMGEAPENNDSLTENVQIEAPIQSAPIVCVMDSGIQEEHTITIQKGWRPMKQRSILVTFLLCVLLLTGCGTAAPAPDATPTPTQEAAAAPTPTPDPLSTLPYEDGQLYAAAYLGYLEPKDLDFFRQTYFGGRELPVHHISDGDFYLIIPRDPNATVRLLRNDMLTQTSSIFYEQPDGSPFVIGCNVSDIFPDVTVEITASDGEKVSFSPFISLEDGSVEVGERGLNITRISTAP